MKRLILLFCLLPVLLFGAIDTTGTTTTPPPINPINFGQGVIYNDSLWNGVYVLPNDTSITGSDTTVVLDTLSAKASVIIPLGFEYEWAVITVIDTGTTYTDSCSISFLAYTFNQDNSRRVPRDTIASSIEQVIPFFRDTSWTNVSNTAFPPDNSSVHSYQLAVGGLAAIKIEMNNAEIVNNKIWEFILQLSRKK